MQKLLGQVRRCVEDYRMIDAGDTVAVGVSGGKDSLVTLTALARLRAFYPIPFTVHAITLETGTPGMCFDAVADHAFRMGKQKVNNARMAAKAKAEAEKAAAEKKEA